MTKTADGTLPSNIIYETRSKYGLITVKNFGGILKLFLNGAYTHSIYDPINPITDEDYWDYLLLGQIFLTRPLKRMCVLGLGGGTAVSLFNHYFKPAQIDGVEIDEKIIEVGKKYLALSAPNLTIYNEDAKEFIKRTSQTYDLIIVDVFNPGGQELSCNTPEFFSDVKSHLNDQGVVVVNHFDTTHREGLIKNFDSIFRIPIHLNQVLYCQKTKLWTLEKIKRRLTKFIGSNKDFGIFKEVIMEKVL